MNMESTYKIVLENRFFTLYELTEGVYAAIEKGSNTGSNAGIIDLGDSTVIFDTFLNIDAAVELKNAGEQLTGRTARYIINSHFHTDHFIGNCLFPEAAAIISTEGARSIIEQGRRAFEEEKEQYVPRIKEINSLLKSGEDISNIKDLNNELQFLSNLVKPGVEICAPNLTIDKGMIIYGSKRSLHLKTFEAAHSRGDMIAYLPDDKICFMGDLLTKHTHTWLGSGSPEQFIEALQDILKYEASEYIPGHGALSDKEDVLNQIKYIREMMELVNKKDSMNAEDYSVKELSPVFWNWESLCFSWNIAFLIGQLKKGGKDS